MRSENGDRDGMVTETDKAVEVENASFAYDETEVLTDVSFSVEEGGYHALVGPNGAGKSTLLKLALGRLVPYEGEARLFGEPAHRFDEGGRIGYVSQNAPGAGERMPVSVREVVRMGRVPHAGLSRFGRSDHDKVEKALRRAGIADIAERRIGELSGGQRQRAYIARALAGEPDLLALDEPTVGVDAEARDSFYALLRELNDEGITVLLIEHDIETVVENAETVTCVNKTVFYDGDADDFLDSDGFVEAYRKRTPSTSDSEGRRGTEATRMRTDGGATAESDGGQGGSR